MKSSHLLSQIGITSAIIAFGLFAYSFSGAQGWIPPEFLPPDGNISAPINVGSVAQVKQGNLGVNILATPSGSGAIWSDQYCDAQGNNCQSLINGSSTPTVPIFLGHLTLPDVTITIPDGVSQLLITPTGSVSCSLAGISATGVVCHLERMALSMQNCELMRLTVMGDMFQSVQRPME